VTRPFAADDFSAIRARMEELRRERARLPAGMSRTSRSRRDLITLPVARSLLASPASRRRSAVCCRGEPPISGFSARGLYVIIRLGIIYFTPVSKSGIIAP
jgi:hypothetical protein